MNKTEMSTLLAVIAQVDNRAISPADVIAWHGILGDLTLPECQDAVTAHRRDSTDWLQPAHVRKRVLAARQDAAMRELPTSHQPRALPSAETTFGGLPIPGRPAWAQRVYEEARDLQRAINAMRKADGRPPTYDSPTRADLQQLADQQKGGAA